MKETTGFQLFPRDSITPSRLYFYICFCTQQNPFLDMITRSFLGAIKESRNNSNSHSVNAHNISVDQWSIPYTGILLQI